MNTYSIKEVSNSVDRYKVYILLCSPDRLIANISFIQSQNVSTINVGKELALFIDGVDDKKYLNIDVFDRIKKILDGKKSKLNSAGNDIVAIYNLGILLEPALELKATQLLKDFSKSAALIIIWENQMEQPDILNWTAQNKNYFIDFSETQLKTIQYEV